MGRGYPWAFTKKRRFGKKYLHPKAKITPKEGYWNKTLKKHLLVKKIFLSGPTHIEGYFCVSQKFLGAPFITRVFGDFSEDHIFLKNWAPPKYKKRDPGVGSKKKISPTEGRES